MDLEVRRTRVGLQQLIHRPVNYARPKIFRLTKFVAPNRLKQS